MKLNFFGATDTVTGSKTLVTLKDEKILVDCGMFQGFKHHREKNWRNLPFKVNDISAVLLTHAHVDHSGLLPLLARNGFAAPIYCTRATRELCEILLFDSARLQEEDAEYANRKGFSKHSPALPLFDSHDVEKILRYFKTVEFNHLLKTKHSNIRFQPAGHILGAASIDIEHHGVHLCFSGDIGRSDDLMMPPPQPFSHADVLISESTYGDRLHPKEDSAAHLADIINATLRNEGTVIIPTFAVGRAQVLLKMVSDLVNDRRIPHVPVYLDSPMAIRATAMLSSYIGEHRFSARDIADIQRVTTFVEDSRESKRVTLNSQPKIVLSASGMATGGRVLHYLKNYLPSQRNSIVLAGFQAEGTRGASLKAGAETVRIHGEQVPVRAQVHSLEGLSAHADRSQLLNWFEHLAVKPKYTFLNHGDPRASEGLRVALRDRFQIEATIPDYAEDYVLGDSL